jgi:hypothetical protein
MSDYLHPEQSPYTSPSPAPNLPYWHNGRFRRYQYKFIRRNIHLLAKPLTAAQPEIEAATLSGQKRKAIKLEQFEDSQKPCTHLVWHRSFLYCSICIDPTKVKKEDLDIFKKKKIHNPIHT